MVKEKLRILSRSSEPLWDRDEAGWLLGRELIALREQNAVVLGIPRGGLVVARQIAQTIGAELDIILSHKLRTPDEPELAMGSVAEDGRLFLNENVVREFGVSKAYIEEERQFQFAEIKRRAMLIRSVRPKVPLKDRLVIVIDDGVATGATTQAALWAVRQEKPERIIAAIPVGAEETLLRLSDDADEVICLRAPPFFAAIGQFYVKFDQVEDEEVLRILKEAK